MIFVTVGTDTSFDRLVAAVDAWAGRTGQRNVFAQIGETKLRPRFIQYQSFLEPPEFQRHFAAASIIISHAGMGTILTALRHNKPLLVMPRRAALGEQRNDHQLATARHLLELGKISVAFDENELVQRLDNLEELSARDVIGPYANPELITTIQHFIHGNSGWAPRQAQASPAFAESSAFERAPLAGLTRK